MKKIFIYLIFVLISICNIYAYLNITKFDDDTSLFNISSNTTKTITIPKGSVLSNSTVDIYRSNYTDTCGQETTSFLGCSQINNSLPKPIYYFTGDYSPSIASAANVNDSSYATSVNCLNGGWTAGSCYVYVNYSITYGATNLSSWIVTIGDGVNLSSRILNVCLNQTKLQLELFFRYDNMMGGSRAITYCYGNGVWNTMQTSGWDYNHVIYEESMQWNINSNVRQLQVKVNNSQVFASNLDINTNNRIFLNSSGNFDYCVRDANACNITFGFVGGSLTVENLSVNYSYILNISIFDEQSLKPITGYSFIEMYGEIWKNNYSSTTGNFEISNVPPGNYEIKYGANTYATRYYYLTIAQSTSSYNFYLLNSTDTGNAYKEYLIVDESASLLKNATIIMQRKYIDCNCYRDMEMSQSNEAGKGFVFAELYDASYRFSILYDGKNVKNTSDTKLSADSDIYFKVALNTANITSLYDVATYVTSEIGYEDSTNIWTYDYNDFSGSKISSGKLEVFKAGNYGDTTVCSTTLDATSGTLTCNQSAYVNQSGTFKAYGYVTASDGTEYRVISQQYQYTKPHLIFGLSGVFLSVIIIMVFALIGHYNPAVSMGLTMAGLVFVSFAGIWYVQTTWLIGILVVGFILMQEVKT